MIEFAEYTPTRNLVVNAFAGRAQSVNVLFEQSYVELHRIAERHLARWNGHSMLDGGGLVHEAYLKLRRQPCPRWESRRHFLRSASRTMRHILVNQAAYWRRKKRGGRCKHLAIDDCAAVLEISAEGGTETVIVDRLSVERALERLAKKNQRAAAIVRCRYMQDLTVEETADVLGISAATVKRDWAASRNWFCQEYLVDRE